MKHSLRVLLFCLILASGFSIAETPEIPLHYFPKDYAASKARFLGYAAKIEDTYRRVEIDQIPIRDLSVDTLYIPAQKTKRKLVILTSGNHGPEAYTGSALQALFVEEVLPTLDLSETGVLLIHALNPWGFVQHRRGTENNVNLNRNFDVSPELLAIKNLEYEKVRSLVEKEGPVKSAWSMPAIDLLLEMILKSEVTRQTLTEAISKGQYHSPLGINYGGNDFEPQTVAIRDLLKDVAAPYPAIFHIDVHTGLGDKGVLHVMPQKEMTDATRAVHANVFNQPGDKGHYRLTPPDTEGFYEVHGDYADILGKLFPEKTRIIVGVTAEFGTVGNGLIGKTITINRMILENQGHNYGYASREIEKSVKDGFLDLFFPSDPNWRRKVLKDGRFFLQAVVTRFISQTP